MVPIEPLLKSLPFPTSFYAWARWVQGQDAYDCGFAIFQEPGEDFATAQARLIEQVLHYLPESPKRTVLYSGGLGGLLATAIQRGLPVKGLFPEPAHHAIAAHRCPDSALLPSARWETLSFDAGSYDTVLFQDASRYVDPLGLLGKAYRALTEAGSLILLDEFATESVDSVYEGHPRLPYLTSLAERCGFVLRDQEDLSPAAIRTLDDCQQWLARHGAELAERFPLGKENLTGLEQLNRRHCSAYDKGQRVYQLLHFKKHTDSRWRVSHVDRQDFVAVSRLFQRVFGHQISPQLWSWKYGQGRGQGSVAWVGEQIVAHYGGITRPIRYFGRPERACQVADVMVDQTQRGVLTRKGPFFLTAASLPEACSGYGAKHLIGYGFPNARAMMVAVRLGLYAKVGHIVEVFWPPCRARPSLMTRLRPLENPDRQNLDRIVVPLWEAMSHDLEDAIVGVRDAAWLSHRYLSHPHHDYKLWLFSHRITRTPVGIIVLRRDGQRCELLDVIAPLEKIPLLIQGARRIAADWQMTELYCWISSSYAYLFEQCTGQQRDPDVAIPTSVWTAAPAPEKLKDRWWLMSGDTDFH